MKKIETSEGSQFAEIFLKHLCETHYYKELLAGPILTDEEIVSIMVRRVKVDSMGHIHKAKFIFANLLFPYQDVRESAVEALFIICTHQLKKLGKKKFLKQFKKGIDSLDKLSDESSDASIEFRIVKIRRVLSEAFVKTKYSLEESL